MKGRGETRFSRRGFLKMAGTMALGVPLGMGLPGLRSQALGFGWDPWGYEILDSEEVAVRAYDAYAGFETMKGCAYAAFDSIVNQLKKQIGYPFTDIPTEMCAYGKSGIVGWGHICGALNGAFAAMNLVVGPYGDLDALISEMISWYSNEALPTYQPVEPRLDVVIPATVAKSALCHTSVTIWCRATGYKAHSPERKERCARLTAQVAKKAVAILNAYHSSDFQPSYGLPESVEECGVCHGRDAMDDVKARMDCLLCHDKHGHQHRHQVKK